MDKGDDKYYTRELEGAGVGIMPNMSNPRTGPFDVLKVYTNGTVKIQGGPVQEKVSIC